MARSQETFNKKQREKKRLEKKKSKLEKRENRKNNEKGSIEVGKFADFIILDRDIMKVNIESVLQTRIVATILNGKIVFSNRL